MGYRSARQTLADLRFLLQKLEQERGVHDPRAFNELRRILLRRMGALSRELKSNKGDAGKAEGGLAGSNVKRAA